MTPVNTKSSAIFVACDRAIVNGVHIQRPSAQDKEFAFQNWFRDRLSAANIAYDPSPRNTYPDFQLMDVPEGYEVKGLETPGRNASYDANSAVPSGYHNGRTIFYVFGRYPKAIGLSYPVVDLVICHGDFLNAQHDYVHQNRSFRGFGSYGDILIRDRKMYVPPTVYALATGLEGQRTLIIPDTMVVDEGLEMVGQLDRIESDQLIAGYSFDLQTNALTVSLIPNPGAGTHHIFNAYRIPGAGGPEVKLVTLSPTTPRLSPVPT